MNDAQATTLAIAIVIAIGIPLIILIRTRGGPSYWAVMCGISEKCCKCGKPFEIGDKVEFKVKAQRKGNPPELYLYRGCCEDCVDIDGMEENPVE